ncbi:ABC transporter ATP-binding protein [Dactylosporangium sp. CA-233914]|uniref:ABC transporter ATP-binding protein n=1 Tax=Dactylosporangium sp. CA-233914 TaxID=3239934 RepID=UPI003D90C7DF
MTAGASLARRLRGALGLAWTAAPTATVTLVVAAAAGGLAPVATAWLVKALLDGLAAPGGSLAGVAAGLVAAGVLTALLPHAARHGGGELDRRSGLVAQERLYRGVARQAGLARLEDPAFQDRLQLAEHGGHFAPGQVVAGGLSVVQGMVSVAGFLATLMLISPVTALVVLAAAVPMLLVQLALSRDEAATAWRTGHAERRRIFYGQLLRTPQAAKEIRLFGLGDFFLGRMLTELGGINAEHRRLSLRRLRAHTVLAGLAAVVAGGGLVWVIGRARAGAVSVGDVSVFVAALAGVQLALVSAVQQGAGAYQALLLFEHYEYVCGAPPDLDPPAEPGAALPALRRGIELRDVWFRYSPAHPWVLRGVNLWIPHGSSLALVGVNGAGKSTLVKLLCRFYDPTRGTITWDGTDVRSVPPAVLRERIGAVFQDFATYDLTAAENVAVGDLPALGDHARIAAAARRAGVDEVLRGLPRGYDTLLTRAFFIGTADKSAKQTGVALSGGQWQRVALARALLRDERDLLVLDEPSAGLDAQAEAEVHAALRRHRTGRTSVLVSHRLSTLRDADTIVVLDGGLVAERGTHAELMRLDGRYAALFTAQAHGYTTEPLGSAA